MSKSKSNGHYPAEVHVENPGSVRMRKSRERKKQGIILLRDIPVTPDLAQALIQNNWLHETERNNREAITAAIGACLYQALSAAMKPAEPGKAFVPVYLAAIQDAICWLRPDEREQVTPETAGKAVGVVARCSALAGFVPEVYAARLKQTMVEIQARGVVKFQDVTH